MSGAAGASGRRESGKIWYVRGDCVWCEELREACPDRVRKLGEEVAEKVGELEDEAASILAWPASLFSVYAELARPLVTRSARWDLPYIQTDTCYLEIVSFC